MITLYLILAHLIGDYPLQPLKLIQWKVESWKGVATHVAIHFVVTTVILSLIIPPATALLLALILASFHYVIDITKAINEKTTKHFLTTYWIDQAAHLTTILIVSYIAGLITQPTILPLGINLLVAYIAALLFAVYAIEYAAYQKKRTTKKSPEHRFNRKALIQRVFIVSLIFVGLTFILNGLSG